MATSIMTAAAAAGDDAGDTSGNLVNADARTILGMRSSAVSAITKYTIITKMRKYFVKLIA